MYFTQIQIFAGENGKAHNSQGILWFYSHIFGFYSTVSARLPGKIQSICCECLTYPASAPRPLVLKGPLKSSSTGRLSATNCGWWACMAKLLRLPFLGWFFIILISLGTPIGWCYLLSSRAYGLPGSGWGNTSKHQSPWYLSMSITSHQPLLWDGPVKTVPSDGQECSNKSV